MIFTVPFLFVKFIHFSFHWHFHTKKRWRCHFHLTHPEFHTQRSWGSPAGRAASVTCSKRTWCSHFWSPPVRSTWPLKLCSRPKMWGKVPSRSVRWRKSSSKKSNGHVHFGVFNRDSLVFWEKIAEHVSFAILKGR